jgi:hypothetical protein
LASKLPAINQKLASPLQVKTYNAPTALPKGAKLLQSTNSLLPSTCLQRGVFVSGQHLQQDEVDRIVPSCSSPSAAKSGMCEKQTRGIPWSNDGFVQKMVEFGHLFRAFLMR